MSLAGGVAVVFTLAACSLLPGLTIPATAGSAATPKVGQCWNASTTQAGEWAYWKGPAATPCGRSHVLYTYQVGKISGETRNSWASPNASGQLSEGIQLKAQDACAISTLLPHEKWNQQLINAYFFVPTEAQWKAGARWVRCDVGVFAIGSTLSDETFAPLPATISAFVNAVTADPLRFGFCIDSSIPVTESGPLEDDDATIADCRDHPKWRLALHGTFPDAAGAPFPDDASSNAATTKLCAPGVTGANEIWTAYLPSTTSWASGDREIECWVGVTSPDDSAGTA